ncbi:MAG: hypothetical protein QF464_00005, partial [Myxococcota bacterium]|nr:hypothetical protein [Myxococcota bacterium]
DDDDVGACQETCYVTTCEPGFETCKYGDQTDPCEGKVCGPDGQGGSCGPCELPQLCDDTGQQCGCPPGGCVMDACTDLDADILAYQGMEA